MKAFLREAAVSFSFNTGAKEIIRNCQPFLNKWDFENFYYVRITRKGEMVFLTNHVDYAMDYWEAGLPMRTGFDDVLKKTQSYVVSWENFLDKEILDFAKDQHCFDGFSFVNRYPDTLQFASFLRSSPSGNASDFYLTHQDELRCWLREFEWKNRHLIREAELSPMILPQDYLAPQKEAFYPERTLKLRYRNIQSKISFRELDCLQLHCRGFTCPRIASLLALSPRTVETHLESVKNSFGLFSRDELAAFAYSNPQIQTYFPRLSGFKDFIGLEEE